MGPRVKIYRHDKGIILVGKAWEIQAKLKEYSHCYETVDDWVKDEKKRKIKANRRGIFHYHH